MIGPSGGSGPGWYYKGKHYDAPQLLHEAMNAEIQRLELQVGELKKALGSALDSCPTCSNCGPCSDHPPAMHDLLRGTQKPVGQPLFVCNKCGYGGPVQYPHYRFQDNDTTEFCAYYALAVTDKRKCDHRHYTEVCKDCGEVI